MLVENCIINNNGGIGIEGVQEVSNSEVFENGSDGISMCSSVINCKIYGNV